jgi:hypothetical protein
MRLIPLLLVPVCLAGCATPRTALVVPANPAAESPVVREAAATRVVETRYELRGYRDPDDPTVRHEPHAVYRTTRVPARVASLDTAPRADFAPVSYAPLPASAELAAELSAQKQITADLRTIQARMAAVEEQARSQYGTLVSQTAEMIQLRRQLGDERAQAQDPRHASRPDSGATPPTAAADESKW